MQWSIGGGPLFVLRHYLSSAHKEQPCAMYLWPLPQHQMDLGSASASSFGLRLRPSSSCGASERGTSELRPR